MLNKILVALDGSEGGKRAVAAAVEHAKETDAGLILVYVIDWSPYSFNTPQELEERHQRRESEIERARELILQPAVDALADSGLSIESIVRHGKIAQTLVNLAKKNDVSQIYIGGLANQNYIL